MLSMRVSLSTLLLLAIFLPFLSTTSSALPISGDRTIEIRAESCPKGPQRQLSVKDRVKQTLYGCFGGGKIFLGYRYVAPKVQMTNASSRLHIYLMSSFVHDVNAKTLTTTTISVGEGALLTPFVDQWYDSNVCAVYANKKNNVFEFLCCR
ncbi:MAG: hypothetical protein NXY57DRAFT_406789 [Lentinula lateritia]|nr:MAG: hypothetical protein NXY57DRAFT_406789 [Lentinula lateritia]